MCFRRHDTWPFEPSTQRPAFSDDFHDDPRLPDEFYLPFSGRLIRRRPREKDGAS